MQSKLALQGSEGEGGAARLAVTPAALRQLEAYTWPGNISVRVGFTRVILKPVTPVHYSFPAGWALRPTPYVEAFPNASCLGNRRTVRLARVQ